MKKRLFEKLPYRLDLQYFAEGDPPPNDPPPNGDPPPADPPKDEPITLTAAELQKRIDSETDKKLDKALDTHRKKWEAEFSQKLEAERKEAERLAKLSAKEREEAELQKQRDDLERRMKELEFKELKADAISDLNEKGLPTSFVDFLVKDDAETTLANINEFKTAFDQAVEAKVQEKLKGKTPPSGSRYGSKPSQSSLREKARQNRIIKK